MLNLLNFGEELKVISGMQNGADQAALFAAEFAGIATGGHAPKGYRTLTGNRPDLGARFCVVEDGKSNYQNRTELNVLNADATLQIAFDFQSPGELLTSRMVNKHHKLNLHVPVVYAGNAQPVDVYEELKLITIRHYELAKTVDFLISNNVRILNVAGNSENTRPGIQRVAFNFLVDVFMIWKERAAQQ
jgi:hypothetical protein